MSFFSFLKPAGATAELDQLFRHVEKTWRVLGENEPHWSVLTHEKFLKNNLNKNAAEFFDSGEGAVSRIREILGRHKLDPSSFKSIIELGCGIGRETRFLAGMFETVHACDISASHLKACENYLREISVSNVIFHHITSLSDFDRLPEIDMVYSVIVLQHNPPPLISHMLTRMFRALKPGGIALFQVPTFRKDYAFSLKEYLNAGIKRNGIEMHVFPQNEIEQIAANGKAEILEVTKDNWTGNPDEISNTFLVKKKLI